VALPAKKKPRSQGHFREVFWVKMNNSSSVNTSEGVWVKDVDITLEENEKPERRTCIWSAIHKSQRAMDMDDSAKFDTKPTQGASCPIKDVLNLSENDVVSGDMKLTAYELQYALRSMGTLVPTDEIVSLFTRARDTELNDSGSHQDLNGCFYSMSIERMSKQLNTDTTFKRGFTYQVYKNLASNINAVLDSLYIVAGALYVIATPINNQNMYLVANMIFLLNSAKFLIIFPLNELRARVQSDIEILKFKEAILINSAMNAIENPLEIDSKLCISKKSKSWNIFQYIENEIFQGDPNKVLTKRDLEMLLLRELGVTYSGRVLSDLLSAMDEDKTMTISAVEFNHFLLSNHEKEDNEASIYIAILRHIWSVFEMLVTDLNYIMTVLFFLGAFLYIFEHFYILPTLGGARLANWLFLVGCFAFTAIDYDRIRDGFDEREKAKKMMIRCVKYTSYYNRNSDVWKAYNSGVGLNIESFQRLLQEASISMSEGEIEAMFHKIDADGSGFLSSYELNTHLKKIEYRRFAIALLCAQDGWFLSNCTWWIGTIIFVVSDYVLEDPRTLLLLSIFGSLGFLIGGIGFCRALYVGEVSTLSNKVKLVEQIKNLLLISSYRRQISKLSSVDTDKRKSSTTTLRQLVGNLDGTVGLKQLKKIIFVEDV